MTAQELFAYLTTDAGLDEATAKVIMDAAKNEKVAAKAAALKQGSEYDTLNARATALEEKATKAGKYQEWYEKNFAAVQKLAKDVDAYNAKYGSLDAPKEPLANTSNFSPDDVKKVIQESYTTDYGPRVVNLFTNGMAVLERHMRAGRKSQIDWKKLDELAASTNGDINKAYEEWDRPAAEEASKAAEVSRQAAEDARVEKRARELAAKNQTNAFFPAGADATPSSGSTGILRPSDGTKKYDRNAVIAAAVTGDYDGGKSAPDKVN